jgi:hypothetical protein
MHATPWEGISALVIHFRVRAVVRQLDQQADVLAQLFDVRAVLGQGRACLLNSRIDRRKPRHLWSQVAGDIRADIDAGGQLGRHRVRGDRP